MQKQKKTREKFHKISMNLKSIQAICQDMLYDLEMNIPYLNNDELNELQSENEYLQVLDELVKITDKLESQSIDTLKDFQALTGTANTIVDEHY